VKQPDPATLKADELFSSVLRVQTSQPLNLVPGEERYLSILLILNKILMKVIFLALFLSIALCALVKEEYEVGE